jgi:hypothetical protein
MVDDLPRLPEPLRSAAFQANNGEWAWPRDAALAASEWLADNGFAVLGGETWLVGPDRVIRIPYFWGWDVSEQRVGEGWEAFACEPRKQRGANCRCAAGGADASG